MPPSHSHHASVFADRLYKFSLFSLIALLTVTLVGTAYDIGQQVISRDRGLLRFSDTAITGGGYFLVAILSAIISISRLWTIRRTLASIPKGYMPLGEDELDKNVYRLTASEYTRCAMITHFCAPSGRTLPGWGAVDTDYENIRFREAILQTLPALESVARPFLQSSASESQQNSSLHGPPLLHFLPLLQPSSRVSTRTATAITATAPIIPSSLLPLLQLYEQHLENAKWASKEPSQQDYEECLRVVAVLIDIITKRIKTDRSIVSTSSG